MYQKATALALSSLSFLGVVLAIAQAATYSSCTNSYQSGIPAPTGYGAIPGGLDVSADCSCSGYGNSGVAAVFQSAHANSSLITITAPWLAGPDSVSVTPDVLNALAGTSAGTIITLYAAGGSSTSGASTAWSCVVSNKSSQASNQTSKNTSSNSLSNVQAVSLSNISNNATISARVGDILDFTSGNSNVGSSVVSSSNPSVVVVLNSTQAQANAAGKAVVTVNLFSSTGNGQTGSPVPHYVAVNVQ
jgi:hypothetical protein